MQNRLPSDFTLDRYGVHVRFVNEGDAEFIVQLRTNDKLGRFIKATSVDVDAQREWIRAYKKQETAGDGYYFIYEVDGVPYGVNRIAKFIGDDFEIGSWVFSPESPTGAAISADIILKEIAFDMLKCDNCIFDVRNNNFQVQKYHLRYKPEITRTTDSDTYFKLSQRQFSINKNVYIKLLNLK